MADFHALIAEANSLGLRVNNCFQLREGWQANFRPADDGGPNDLMVFGRGDTPEAALESALKTVKKVLASSKSKIQAPFVPDKPIAAPVVADDIDDLL